MSVIADYQDELLGGMLTTIQLSIVTFPLAFVLGVLLSVLRLCPVPLLRAVGTAYVEVVRNAPVLVLIAVIVFGLPEVGLTIPLFTCVVVGLSMYFACYVCETVRSGIRSVSVGEIEAARALGLATSAVFRTVVLPQSLRSMVQPLATIFINIVLGSALGAAMGVHELTGTVRSVNLLEAQPILCFALAGLGYLVMTLTIGHTAGVIERRVRVVR
ncbi:amino acid ABC transporter permease [Jiangella anatolica]|uniref:Amino acid ABC transporter permease n=1 Tax=Jiangella anatolica TaxID=2670374 RepID=A0A2W2CNW6_9ACTN|nr:amino acid ABC transporter permease [Jiangella anatolica]PZF81933.1 amino acid ABC transporter permease [Jiangella anatolica]